MQKEKNIKIVESGLELKLALLKRWKRNEGLKGKAEEKIEMAKEMLIDNEPIEK